MIFRNDDVSANTDLKKLKEMYSFIYELYPEARIINGVSLFCKKSSNEAIYDELPLRNHFKDWFYNVDMFRSYCGEGEIASHGLIHNDHAQLSKDAQKMSILTSCNYLKTKMFIPPFNSFNSDTVDICKTHNIELIGNTRERKWRSLESESLDPSHKHWYFHSWRLGINEFKNKINSVRAVSTAC